MFTFAQHSFGSCAYTSTIIKQSETQCFSLSSFLHNNDSGAKIDKDLFNKV